MQNRNLISSPESKNHLTSQPKEIIQIMIADLPLRDIETLSHVNKQLRQESIKFEKRLTSTLATLSDEKLAQLVYEICRTGTHRVAKPCFEELKKRGRLDTAIADTNDENKLKLPLYIATEHGHHHLIKLLMACGADIHTLPPGEDHDFLPSYPLCIAIKNLDSKSVQLLLAPDDVYMSLTCHNVYSNFTNSYKKEQKAEMSPAKLAERSQRRLEIAKFMLAKKEKFAIDDYLIDDMFHYEDWHAIHGLLAEPNMKIARLTHLLSSFISKKSDQFDKLNKVILAEYNEKRIILPYLLNEIISLQPTEFEKINEKSLRIFLQELVKINSTFETEKYVFLYEALKKNNLKLAKILMDMGANPFRTCLDVDLYKTSMLNHLEYQNKNGHYDAAIQLIKPHFDFEKFIKNLVKELAQLPYSTGLFNRGVPKEYTLRQQFSNKLQDILKHLYNNPKELPASKLMLMSAINSYKADLITLNNKRYLKQLNEFLNIPEVHQIYPIRIEYLDRLIHTNDSHKSEEKTFKLGTK